ncbi:hypothetical protein V8G54_013402 [Vigna mungo]|uniref:Uncharacterized protein n=1 Tax=Vigna mungo TaxID=3915 RepID=A0AAQ3NSW3_VIGMU
MRPSTIPNLSLITFASGARQLVVQLALETTVISDLYSFSLTPTTNIGASLLGAEIITFFAPPFRWAAALSLSVKTPVDSTIKSAPDSLHGISSGFLIPYTLTELEPKRRVLLSLILISQFLN